MNTLEFITKYLNSPIVAHRNKSLLCLFKERSNTEAIKQLGLNLDSNNFDIVLNSLRVIFAISHENQDKVKAMSAKIAKLGLKTNHFSIVFLCRDILNKIDGQVLDINRITKRITPKLNGSENADYFSDNCDHFLEYSLGDRNHKYELSRICRTFRYDCKKATKQLFAYMRALGYKKGTQYWKERPSRWQHDFDGNRYETKLNYFARHGIQMFLMWCVNNLTARNDDWSEFLIDERNWDASMPQLMVQERPSFLHFTELKTETNIWIKQKINKKSTYEFFDPKKEWFPLYENSSFKHEDKSFDRHITACFIKPPVSNISRKLEFSTPNYSCRNCYINELPLKAKQNGRLYLDDSGNRHDGLKDKLFPSYGIVSEDFDDCTKLFPAPEIIEHFKLTQKKNTLNYYKGRKLVAYCLNWQDGYYRNVGRQGEDRFELANYGHLLMIKTKYLKKYLKDKKLKLLITGSVWKRKVDKWSHEGDYSNKKTSKHKWLSFEIVKF
ncbi:MAG: hypothetical protein UW07_C0012G0002 [Candidatus Nomurabacteria bacterium GW2011_GWF2_43_8]|uniref:Uncharacterized protein n=1 Tax=Candidatus Nomurabacteria bacterium GW2011_GWF2_43_8 TaxID=1618779 RepID=A0A0G1IN17_9BACT|nr:MAG: hypothetical protein UW07_C0012G0002 [Candidatus Nomurabacteria bacterium GW2011_GWF2_43_8]